MADRLLFDGDKINIRELRPGGRLARAGDCTGRDLFEMKRAPSAVAL